MWWWPQDGEGQRKQSGVFQGTRAVAAASEGAAGQLCARVRGQEQREVEVR